MTEPSVTKPAACSVCGVERVRLWKEPIFAALFCQPCAETREGVRTHARDEAYTIGNLFPSFARLGASHADELAWFQKPLVETRGDGAVVYARHANVDGLGAVTLVAKPGEALRIEVVARSASPVMLAPDAVRVLSVGIARHARETGTSGSAKRRKRRRGGTKNPATARRDREPDGGAETAPLPPRENPADIALRWNAAHPVGTPVRYWTGLREGPGVESRTRAAAVKMSDHASVWVEGLAGSINLSHVEVIR